MRKSTGFQFRNEVSKRRAASHGIHTSLTASAAFVYLHNKKLVLIMAMTWVGTADYGGRRSWQLPIDGQCTKGKKDANLLKSGCIIRRSGHSCWVCVMPNMWCDCPQLPPLYLLCDETRHSGAHAKLAGCTHVMTASIGAGWHDRGVTFIISST